MKARVLFVDIETSPLEVYCWGLGEQRVSLDQIIKGKDWSILSISMKWKGERKVYYFDTRKRKNVRDDKQLCKIIKKFLNEADIVIGQNSKRFDVKRIYARFAINKTGYPTDFQQIDTLQEAKRYLGFTSHKLAYMSAQLCPNHKKSEHKKYPGLSLWKECLKGNIKAWKEMELYNKQDVVALEKVYDELSPLITTINFDVFHESLHNVCRKCFKTKFHKNGFYYKKAGMFQRFVCVNCGTERKSNINLLSKEKKASLRK